jgi:hypothetical protein
VCVCVCACVCVCVCHLSQVRAIGGRATHGEACYSGVTSRLKVVLQWCDSGVTVVLQWCTSTDSGLTVV